MAGRRLTRNITLALMLAGGVTAYTVYSGRETQADTFRDEASCTASGLHTAEECREALVTAQAEHEKNRPEFARREDCEADFGAAQCQPTQSGGFAPLFWGFMLGRMMSGNSGAGIMPGMAGNRVNDREDDRRNAVTPVYGGSGRGIFTSAGARVPASGKVSSSIFKRSGIMARSYVAPGESVMRGGFGSTGRSLSIHS